MFLGSAILFALAALGGLALAALHFRAGARERPPTALAVVHGLAAAAALVLLIIGVLGPAAGGSGLPVIALVLFVVAALGGAYMFLGKHLRGQPLPGTVVVLHGLLAVAGFLVLLAFLLGGAA
ncbi:MAG: hypothetical protein M0015_12050 [Betaproteobacteria bacterium]|nr:hypothetical protein [Betaproteobacteria bacterium]